MLWQHNGLSLYLELLGDPYFQLSALESIISWYASHVSSSPSFSIPFRLQDEMARVEDELTKPVALDALLACFVSAKTNSFENLLDPFLKLFRTAPALTVGLARPALFHRITDRLAHHKGQAVVRLKLLRILRAVCEAHPNRVAVVERFGLYGIVSRMSREDGAVLVRELAREIKPILAPALRPAQSRGNLRSSGGGAGGEGKSGAGAGAGGAGVAPRRNLRRTASEANASVLVSPAAGAGAAGAPPVPPLPGKRSGSGPLGTSSRAVSKSRPRQRLGDISWQIDESFR
jgi:hypothetical protein